MANDLTKVTPKLLAQGQMALREFAITPRLVNRGYEVLAGQKGSTIDVPIPSAIAVQAVSPAATPPSTADMSPTSIAVALDQWYESPFYLTDRDMLEAMNGTIPMQASEAIKGLANKIDQSILGEYKKFYGYYGTAGTTPFGTPGVKDATNIRKILNKQLSPLDPRHVLLDPEAEAAALALTEFANGQYSGSVDAILNGNLNRKLGMQWWMNQNLTAAAYHTAGTGSGYLVNNGAGYAAGIKTIAVDTGSGTILEGDIFTFAGHAQTYVATTALAAGVLVFEPGLQVAVADNVAITLKASHQVNLAIHRDAIAFASRPLERAPEGMGGVVSESVVDEITGIALRLEITREHKRTRFSYDALWGKATVRRELGARLAG